MKHTRLVAALAGIVLAACLVLLVRLDLARQAQPGPALGGPFRLVAGDGRQVTDASFAGDWRLVYFGYTHCPDACPTTLSKLAAALDKLPAAARAHLRVLFITVDPARDTPSVMDAYAKAFGPEFTGLTGTQAQLDKVETGYAVYARRHELKGGDYAMDHSSIVYVMAPDGHYVGLLDDGLSPGEMAGRLAGLGV